MPRREDRTHFAVLLKIYFVSTSADIQKVFQYCYFSYCYSFKSCLTDWTVVNNFHLIVFGINSLVIQSLFL